MNLLCQLWSLNETIQEFKAQQSRHSSLSPHGWLDPEEEQELDSDGSDEEEYYNQQYGHAIDGPEDYADDNYSQPYRSQEEAIHTSYRNGHGNSAARLRPVPEHERQYRSRRACMKLIILIQYDIQYSKFNMIFNIKYDIQYSMIVQVQ